MVITLLLPDYVAETFIISRACTTSVITPIEGCSKTMIGCTLVQGMLKGEELSAAYASADIFIMPSETETLGFVALEAMASGLPVVAVAAGGLTDIITQPGITSKRWQLSCLEASPFNIAAVLKLFCAFQHGCFSL